MRPLAGEVMFDLVWKKDTNFTFQAYSLANLSYLTLMMTLTEGTFGDLTETEGNFVLRVQSKS